MVLANERIFLMLPIAEAYGLYEVCWKPTNLLRKLCSGPEV